MYKVFINHTDYDSPYSVGVEEMVCETLTEANEYCKSQEARRDKYNIEAAYKDGKQVDIQLQLALEQKGVEGIRESMIKQLNDHVEKINSAKEAEELANLKQIYLGYWN